MGGFPRSCFSEKELSVTRWYARKNGVSGQPSIKQVKNHRSDILNVAGVKTTLIEGQLGNLFAINDWLKIIEHASPFSWCNS
jgi:glucan phosphoethanolaminetransferase (alkaline phosphatase superfamily)